MSDFAEYGIPIPDRANAYVMDTDIIRETSYEINPDDIQVKENQLLSEQKRAYDRICESVESDKGDIFFLDAPGGTGKTFLLNLILAKIRQQHNIALAVASSGIAATLLDGGKTAHSTFGLSSTMAEQGMIYVCNITKQSARGNLLKHTKLIVWDECTMTHRRHLDAVDVTMRDLRDSDRLMGGVTFVLAGDFRQTLPVIPKGSMADEIDACLNHPDSFLWKQVKTLKLTTNMRAHVHGDETAAEFAKELLLIGNGELPINASTRLHTLPCGRPVKDIDDLIESVFPNTLKNLTDHTWLHQRSILAPRNDTVDGVNRLLLNKLPSAEKSYKSIDRVCPEEDATRYPVEFLNAQQPSGIPPHNLILKVGAPIMMLRNINPPLLCNGTRLAVTKLGEHIIEAVILFGSHKGKSVHIPRIPFIPQDIAFRFKRMQFPIRLSFAMSINKSQGQSLKVVGLHLEKSCFSHGQLYVGCSRVSSSQNLFLYTGPAYGTHWDTDNRVYKQVLTGDGTRETDGDLLHTSETRDVPSSDTIHPTDTDNKRALMVARKERAQKQVATVKKVVKTLTDSLQSVFRNTRSKTSTKNTIAIGHNTKTVEEKASTSRVAVAPEQSLSERDIVDPRTFPKFVNPGTDCWLNSVIRIVVHMLQNVISTGVGHDDMLWLTHEERESDRKANAKESLMRYIKSEIMAAHTSTFCFRDPVISIQGMSAKVSLKAIVLDVIDIAEFRENGGNGQQDANVALGYMLENFGQSFQFCSFLVEKRSSCCVCPFQSKRTEVAYKFMLSVPEEIPARGTFSLSNLILSATQSENQFERPCPRDNCVSRRATETEEILTAPLFLVVSIKFFISGIQTNYRQTKLTQTCDPVHEIDITTKNGKSHTYKLHCIIDHVGESIDHGHYKSYFQINDTWVMVSDEDHTIVHPVQLPKQPYISVFRKKNIKTS